MMIKATDIPEPVAEALLSVVNAVRDYLPPDGIFKEEFIARVIAAVDNPLINPFIRELEDGK